MTELVVEIIDREEAEKNKAMLLEIALLSYGSHADRIGKDQSDGMLANITKDETWQHLLGASVIIVAKQNEEILGAGYLFFSGNAWKFFKNDWAFIRMLGIRPDAGGKGIGTKITKLMEDVARANNEKILALHTSEFMHEARHIYEKQGFKILEELPQAWGKRYWLFIKEL